MAIVFEKKNIIELLKAEKRSKEDIELLKVDYLQKLGKTLDGGCSPCIVTMINDLKKYYNICSFRFKREAASYKNKKGDKTTISNSTLTDEKAIEFLKTNPDRIKLFVDYPENWESLIIEDVIEGSEDGFAHLKKQTYTRDELRMKSLKELRLLFPEVKAVSIEDFINKALLYS